MNKDWNLNLVCESFFNIPYGKIFYNSRNVNDAETFLKLNDTTALNVNDKEIVNIYKEGIFFVYR